jgi:hypothetical protein
MRISISLVALPACALAAHVALRALESMPYVEDSYGAGGPILEPPLYVVVLGSNPLTSRRTAPGPASVMSTGLPVPINRHTMVDGQTMNDGPDINGTDASGKLGPSASASASSSSGCDGTGVNYQMVVSSLLVTGLGFVVFS